VLIASPFCKFAHGIESVQRIPYYVEMATRNATAPKGKLRHALVAG
jgi:thiamine pyrophosphate-dependent acetolactate synthase large subunit-like protein